jgi:UDP-N-acetylenolpyruvoylglucosamine reductase
VVIATERLRRLFRPESEDDPGEFALPTSRVAPVERTRDPRLVAWCGATLPSLVQAAKALGWSGLEGLAGVPGKLGGGIAMNAGGRVGELWDVVERVRVIDERGELVDLERSQCAPRYRDGGLGGRVVVGAVLRLAVDHPEAVKERTRDYLVAKNRVQPVSELSAGCIFKNPDPALSGGRSAGRLVEECGGKGRVRGGAIVSELHGNFIVNRAGATSRPKCRSGGPTTRSSWSPRSRSPGSRAGRWSSRPRSARRKPAWRAGAPARWPWPWAPARRAA